MNDQNLPSNIEADEQYLEFLQSLKDSVRQAQLRAGLSVNRELTLLYWQIGAEILKQQKQQGWGAKVVDRLAADLRTSFPEIKGFSPRNLKYMRAFAEAYSDFTIVQAGPAQIPWHHNCTILDKLKDATERLWYISETIKHGWSRDVLVHQIESGLFLRQGRAVTNFNSTLPKVQSELAQQILKDPYNFDFLNLGTEALERDLERALLEKLRDFLLELGHGFAFIGSQYHLEVGGQDYYIDLLFYHLHLRCYIVVDLKISDFQPEYAGKMAFYLNAVDSLMRHNDDQASIGLILCKTRNSVIAEYTLRNNQNPIGVSEYRLQTPLPDELLKELPAIENLQKELNTAFYWDVGYWDVSSWTDSAAGTTGSKSPGSIQRKPVDVEIITEPSLRAVLEAAESKRGPDFYAIELSIGLTNYEPIEVQHYHVEIDIPRNIVNGTPPGELADTEGPYRSFQRPPNGRTSVRLSANTTTKIASIPCVLRPEDLKLSSMQSPNRDFVVRVFRTGKLINQQKFSFEDVRLYDAVDRAE